jgi:hypothetical protein
MVIDPSEILTDRIRTTKSEHHKIRNSFKNTERKELTISARDQRIKE